MNGPVLVTAVIVRETRSVISHRGGMITKPCWVAYLSNGNRKVCATKSALVGWMAEMGIEAQS